MAKGFDTTEDCAPHVHAIKDAGYTFVCRYYSHSHWKNLSRPEALALSAERIYIVAVWESAGDHAAYFSYVQGIHDGNSAYSFGRAIGQPPDTPIYFAVDYDADVIPDNQAIYGVWAYFRGVRESMSRQVAGTQYGIGVYGSGSVCKTLHEGGMVSFTWLANARRWRGSSAYKDWSIKQGKGGTVAGMSVDLDESAPKGGGGFLVK